MFFRDKLFVSVADKGNSFFYCPAGAKSFTRHAHLRRAELVNKMERKALVLGGTGLVGREVVRLLSAEGSLSRIVLGVRRAPKELPPRANAEEIDYEALDHYPDLFKVDEVYCCLGTTIKTAGSRDAFRRVDFDYVAAAAGLSASNGVQAVAVVSALGADKNSFVFYNRVKGEMEAEVAAAGVPSTIIVRPSLLIGHRAEVRTGEEIGAALGRTFGGLFLGPLRRYKPIEAETVARAMIRLVRENRTGLRIVESDELSDIGKG